MIQDLTEENKRITKEFGEMRDLTEENKRIKEEFREMRDLMNQDFKEKFDDMKVGF